LNYLDSLYAFGRVPLDFVLVTNLEPAPRGYVVMVTNLT